MEATSPFRAMVVEEIADNLFDRRIEKRVIADLPEGEVLIKVDYSSLNYKDALSATGNKGVTRHYPHTPGTDAAGRVVLDQSGTFETGDPVVVTGYDLGMNTSGGFAQYIRVPAKWVVPLPPTLTLKEAMIYGTAGFTAGLGVYRLQKAGVLPGKGHILVTGASGGVGTLAVALLSTCGYSVVASTGKPSAAELLTTLGAERVIGRKPVSNESPSALLPQRWAGAIETVGGVTLSTVLRSTLPGGVVTCCGNVGGADVDLSVYPFILRGVSLVGINSATTVMQTRLEIWKRLASDWKCSSLETLSSVIGLSALDDHIDKILDGQQVGRRVIDVNG